MNKILETKIINILNDRDSINSLSYEEKEELLISPMFVACQLVKKLVKENIKIFNSSESNQFYQNNIDVFNENNHLLDSILSIVQLNDDILIELYYQQSNDIFLNYIQDKQILKKHIKDDIKYSLDFICQLSDQDKITYLKKAEDKESCFKIVNSLKEDTLILEALKYVGKQERWFIIENLSNDDFKKTFITPFATNKGRIIASLSTDEDKIMYYKKYYPLLSAYDKLDIIVSLKNIEMFFDNNFIHGDNLKSLLVNNYSIPKSIRNKLFMEIKRQKCLINCFGGVDEAVIISKLPDITDSKVLIEAASYVQDVQIRKQIYSKINPIVLSNYINDNMGNDIDIGLLNYVHNVSLVIKIIDHSEVSQAYCDEYYSIFQIIADQYNVSVDRLVRIAKISNCSILKLVNNKNIKKVLNLSDNDFDKFMMLFSEDTTKMDISTHSSILNSLLQRRFRNEFANEINIYADTLHAAVDGDKDKVIDLVSKVYASIDKDQYNIDFNDLILGILYQDSSTIRFYHEMANNYVKLKRNSFVNDNMDQAIKSTSRCYYDSDEVSKYIVSVLPLDELINSFNQERINILDLTSLEYELLNNKNLINKISQFRKNPSSFSKIPEDVKQNIKVYNSLLYKCYFNASYSMQFDLKKRIDMLDINTNSLLEIMSKIDADLLIKTVFSDEQLYQKLFNYLKKYKLVGCCRRYDQLDIDVEISADIISSLISNFEKIEKIMQSKKQEGATLNFTGEMDIAGCFDSDASLYTYIFGLDDYNYLRRNPSPNASPSDKQQRISKAVELMPKMHSRKYITIPPIDDNFKLSNNKEINISVGITDDPINLTYGERTGACMRIGGAGESLFEFCLLNENGFHISFNDPKTNHLISRVSGFRNGNTVFLNQLRMPLSDDYSCQDLKKACQYVAKQLIEKTKNSPYPIDNVVISSSYAYFGDIVVDLKVEDIKKSLPNFYSDVSEKAIIVATSNSGQLVPLKLDQNKAERYEKARKKIRKVNNEDAVKAIKSILVRDQLYSNIELDSIEIPNIDSVVCYYGEDWYVSLNRNGQIESFIMNNCQDKEKSNQEMSKYIIMVQNEMHDFDIEQKGKVI